MVRRIIRLQRKITSERKKHWRFVISVCVVIVVVGVAATEKWHHRKTIHLTIMIIMMNKRETQTIRKLHFHCVVLLTGYSYSCHLNFTFHLCTFTLCKFIEFTFSPLSCAHRRRRRRSNAIIVAIDFLCIRELVNAMSMTIAIARLHSPHRYYVKVFFFSAQCKSVCRASFRSSITERKMRIVWKLIAFFIYRVPHKYVWCVWLSS